MRAIWAMAAVVMMAAGPVWADADLYKYKITTNFCMQYETISSNQIYNYAKEIDASPYSIKEILTNPACFPRKIGGKNKITILQLTVESPFSRLEHLTKMHNYLTKRHKIEPIFIDAVNAKNTAGMTMLDYIYFVLGNDEFDSEGRAQVELIRTFVCEHGGVYSEYPEQRCN